MHFGLDDGVSHLSICMLKKKKIFTRSCEAVELNRDPDLVKS